MNWVELVGYAGSALVVVALLQGRLLRLRIFSLVGSVTFGVYGLLIGSVPLVITNLVICAINLWHIWRILTGREDFSLLEVAPDSAYLRRFLDFHSDEIATTQPDFTGVRDTDRIVMILRDMVPTVVIIGKPEGEEFRVFLDYAIPRFRDFKGGKWFYDRRPDFFDRLGVSRVVATGLTDLQRKYLRRAGFEPRPDGKWQRPVGSGELVR